MVQESGAQARVARRVVKHVTAEILVSQAQALPKEVSVFVSKIYMQRIR